MDVRSTPDNVKEHYHKLIECKDCKRPGLSWNITKVRFIGRGPKELRGLALLNYKTEREPALAATLGPLACPSRSARPRKCLKLNLT